MTDKSTAEMLKALGEPFPKNALKQRQGGGGKFTYVETHTVIHRLNNATNGEWSFYVRDTQWRGDLLIVLGELTIPGLGTRSGFGVQKVSERGGEDLVKGAVSDALKKCATLFGTALELYGSDYEASAPAQQPNAPQTASKPPAKPTPINANGDKPITPAAMKRIHALMSEIGLDHSHLTAYAIDQGHQSSKELTMEQVTKLGNGIKEKPEAVAKYLTDLLNKIELQQAGMEVGQQFDAQKAGQ